LHYWEKQLVKLTQFEIALDQTQSWDKDVFTYEHGQPPYKCKMIWFFARFDPYCLKYLPQAHQDGPTTQASAQ
jgi:hypothetical protein